MNVALFDIDGTIVTKTTPGPTSKQLAYTQAIEEVFGISGLNYMDYPIFGLTDRGILQLLLKENGLTSDEITAGESEFAQRMLEIHDALAEKRPQQYGALPGADKLLKALDSRGIKLGLATGNYESLGWFKLRESRLEQWFTFGGFGEAGVDRADIVKDAMVKSRETDLSRVVLLGDTLHDIDAARRNSIQGRAVATGRFSVEELVNYCGKDEYVMTDLRHTESALNCLLSVPNA